MKEHKLEICDNMYDNTCGVFVVLCLLCFCCSKSKVKEEKPLRRNHSKAFPRGSPLYKFYSLTKSFC